MFPFHKATRFVATLTFWVAALLTIVTPAFAGPKTVAGPYHIEVLTAPSMVSLGKGQLLITITDASGKPLEGLSVRALTGMPGMSMGEREELGRSKEGQPGTYQVAAQYPMAGGYESTIQIDGSLGNATAKVTLTTGEDTAGTGSGGFPTATALAGVLVLTLVGFVLYRMRKTGQTLRAGNLLSGQVLGSLALLGLMTVGAIYAVSHWRRPGAMTPMDAQAADMTNMPPPSGAVPVELATVSRGSVSETLRVAGTVVGFTEQDIAPRAPGVLQQVLVYPGDKVAKGQLLARLDTRQSAPEAIEKAAMATMARQGVSVAEAEKAQAEQEVHQAHAELAGKQGALDEARALVTSATEEKASSEAALTAAEAQITGAQAEKQATQADRTYWQQQLARSTKLHDAGAISGEELQRDTAQAATADAKVQQAEAKITEATAIVKAAQSARKKAEAQIVAARAKVAMAQSELDAHNAHVRASGAAVTTAARKVDQSKTGVVQAGAALQAAQINQGFSEIRAESEGVVLQRLISPGTLVSPGQVVLKVAQIRPIRLQATVTESDLARIQVGAKVQLMPRNGKSFAARISSISSQVDPVARTGTVEALVPNTDGRLLPGQYLAFEIETGARSSGLRVPTRAVQYGTESKPFVWLAEPAGPGQLTVKRVPVTLGVVGRDSIEVVSGVSEGQKIVTSGATYLKNGDTVTPVEPEGSMSGPKMDAAGAVVASIKVTEQGYEPATIQAKAGVPLKLTFTRSSDKTCGTEVLFPDYGINQKLPLNVPTTVTFTPKKAGEIAFSCGMNMLKGKMVAQ